jgi:MFS family permease
MFMAFNVGEGMLLVLLPVYASSVLAGSAGTYGLLVSAFSLAALAGSLVVGAVEWTRPLGRSIAVVQTLAGASFVLLALELGLSGTIVALLLAGVLVSPLTIWAQTLRMQLIPEALRGRAFGLLRTLMQATPPIGGAIAGLLLAGPGIAATALVMSAVMTVPGLVGLVSPALSETWEGRRPRARRRPRRARPRES